MSLRAPQEPPRPSERPLGQAPRLKLRQSVIRKNHTSDRMVLDGPQFAELAAEVLSRGAAVRFRAHGRSMFPTVRDGDVVTVQPVEPRALRVGDIAFHAAGGGRPVAHRLLARSGHGAGLSFRTCGDSDPGPGEVVGAEAVLGRVVAVERGGKLTRLDRGLWRMAGPLLAGRALLHTHAAAALQKIRRRPTTAPRNAPRPSAVTRRAGQALIGLCGAFAGGEPWQEALALSPAEWEQVVALARQHGLAAVLYRMVEDLEGCGVPDPLRAGLKDLYVAETARNLRGLEQLAEIAAAAQRAGAELLLLKGSACLSLLYEDVGCRGMADIDFAVRENAWGRLRQAMQQLGYHQAGRAEPVGIDLINMRLGYRHPFDRPGRLPVDVHTCILPGGARNGQADAEMWKQAVSHGKLDRVLLPARAHFLLLAARHYVKHLEMGQAPLCWLLDMLLAVRTWGDDLDWEQFWSAAERWHVRRDVSMVAAALERYWGLPIPLLPEGATPPSSRVLLHGLPGAADRVAAAMPSAYLARLLAVRHLEDSHTRLRYVASLLLPPPEEAGGKSLVRHYVRALAARAGRLLRGLVR